MTGPPTWSYDEHQRCDECGFDPREVRDRELAAAVRALGDRWVVFIDGFEHRQAHGDELLHTRPSAGAWSAVEFAQHLSGRLQALTDHLETTLATGAAPPGWWQDPASDAAPGDREPDPDVLAGHITAATDTMADALHGIDWPRGEATGSVGTAGRMARFALHEGYHHLAAADRSVAAQLPDA